VLSLVLVGSLGLLLLAPADGDDDVADPDPIVAACLTSNEEIGTAQRVLVDDAENPAAAVEGFLGDAFVDLMRDRADAVAATDPPGEVRDVLADQAAVVDAVEADPASAAGETNPFETVNARWRELGLAACAIDGSTVRSDG
jgi:hypothetical protein